MIAAAEKEYAELLRKRRPHAIRDEKSYQDTMREIETLGILGEERSDAETEYFRVLVALVSDYERYVQADQWARMEPRDALVELMQLRDVSQADIARVLGDRAAASSILTGRRKISKTQANALALFLHVDAGIFI